MLYTKPINEISYNDITGFCDQGIKENINLDYKEKIESSLAKTVAAMANTWGGLIVIGIEDKDSAPKRPIKGMEFKEHVEEQINNIILGNINPPVFPEIKVCKSDDGSHMLIVVRVSQSNITPHAIQGGTKVYLRTNTSNEPEELATVDRVLWLTDKRKKSEDLRNGFYNTANERSATVAKRENALYEGYKATFSMCPLYPFEILISHEDLNEATLGKIRVDVSGSKGFHFPMNIHEASYHPTQFGIYSFRNFPTVKTVRYEDINQYGLFSFTTDLLHRRSYGDDAGIPYALVDDIFKITDSMFESMQRFYSLIGYWGILEFKITLNDIEDVLFYHLLNMNAQLKPLTNSFEFIRQITVTELKEKRVEMICNLMAEISRSLGFSITEKSIVEYMKINSRA